MQEFRADNKQADSIDLAELFLGIWAHKLLIVITVSLFSVGSVYHAMTAEKVYKTKSIFAVEAKSQAANVFSALNGNFAGLLSPPAGQGITVEGIKEKLTSRDFVTQLTKQLHLDKDPYFNTFTATAPEPKWKVTLNTLFGTVSEKRDPDKVIALNVYKSIKRLVNVQSTNAGSIAISVAHGDPNRAAQITNVIVENLISEFEKEKIEKIDSRLKYFSMMLASAVENLDQAQRALANFTILNSTQAPATLLAGSVYLDDLRVQKTNSMEYLNALVAIENVLETGIDIRENLKNLPDAHPIITDPDFRDLVGFKVKLGDQPWPRLQVVEEAKNAINERVSMLDREISQLEASAERYAAISLELSQLERDAKVAEATYKALEEQLKSESLLSGLNTAPIRLIEKAEPPATASEPQKVLVVAIGTLSGSFIGVILALTTSLTRGVYFSSRRLIEATRATQTLKLKSLRRFKRKSLSEVRNLVQNGNPSWAKTIVLAADSFPKNRPLLITDASGEDSADTVARIIAATACSLNRSAAFIDMSRHAKASDQNLEPSQINELRIVSKTDTTCEYTYFGSHQNVGLFYNKSWKKILSELLNYHDIVILAAKSDIITVTTPALHLLNPWMVSIIKTKVTNAREISKLTELGKLHIALLK